MIFAEAKPGQTENEKHVNAYTHARTPNEHSLPSKINNDNNSE